MELSLSSIQVLVKEIKEEMFSNIDPYSFVSPSAYDTAWLAMVPDPQEPGQPMFKGCLDWVLNNQREEGFWGECDGHGMPTIESLPATLACVVALKKWNVGTKEVQRGLEFVDENTAKLLGDDHFPRWFAIIFPGMIDLVREVGLELAFPKQLGLSTNIFGERQSILEREELVGEQYPPLLSYLEVLKPADDNLIKESLTKHLSFDGSLFHSPAATARAFMATGERECLAYLQTLVQRCPNGVPPTYPMDEDLIQLCMVNQLQRLGLADHFTQEIDHILAHIHRSYYNQESKGGSRSAIATRLHKDSLAFRLLRMHGYTVSPRSFCWFSNDEKVQDHIEKNFEFFSSVMLNIHRATDLIFPGEYELEKARSFSRKLLEKYVSVGNGERSFLKTMIKHELSVPWIARLDHLEHRMWVEDKDMNAFWAGKTSFHRLPSFRNEKLKKLAAKDYEFRQSIYRTELEELTRWSRKWGLVNLGFAREKTTYCYFAIAACISLPYNSALRMMVAKSAILITIADDFFDSHGSLHDLNTLISAIQRWDGKSLNGHCKTIFDVLDDLVKEIAAKHLHSQGSDITNHLQHLWYETFVSWLVEAQWSRSQCVPSMEEYLEIGMTSIAAHTLVLPISCFLTPSIPDHTLQPNQYETLTKLLMLITRLLNDIQSYQKEEEQGKLNTVLLYLKENPEADIEDSIAYVKGMLETKKKELLQHTFIDGFSDLPKHCKQLHLSCLKVFAMFFHSSNRYDKEDTKMLKDIQQAIYSPLHVGRTSKVLTKKPVASYSGSKEHRIINYEFGQHSKYHSRRVIARLFSPISRRGCDILFMQPKFKLSLV
ncbi:hypothetical protein SLEP1_g28989 [Rubroshorea leprosula]|uniref:Uncharacterized protein n=2 Tax=Rubroshorea leprosula TaxID=152421 RepID=A0AAV5K7B5_9ROSI|nr:hypothetical protein SLEP1_g28989 [Rubroshorea leprosula]